MTNHGNMNGPAFTFLGIPSCDLDDPSTYKGADVIIVGAPIDSGTSHRSGAKFGPQRKPVSVRSTQLQLRACELKPSPLPNLMGCI
jgi:arginase family enzyme